MTLSLIYTVIGLHFLFDWFQPRYIQNNKWYSYEKLSLHTLISTLPFMLLACTFGAEIPTLLFYVVLLYGTHFLLDLITSNIAHLCKMFNNEYGLIITTAVDQFIHLLIYFYIFNQLSL